MSKELTTSGRPVAVPQLGPEARLVLDFRGVTRDIESGNLVRL